MLSGKMSNYRLSKLSSQSVWNSALLLSPHAKRASSDTSIGARWRGESLCERDTMFALGVCSIDCHMCLVSCILQIKVVVETCFARSDDVPVYFDAVTATLDERAGHVRRLLRGRVHRIHAPRPTSLPRCSRSTTGTATKPRWKALRRRTVHSKALIGASRSSSPTHRGGGSMVLFV